MIIINFGIPSSLSENVYLYGKVKDGKLNITKGRILFYFWSAFTLITLLIFWLDKSSINNEAFQPLVFISCAALGFVGTASEFKLLSVNKVHVISALICAILSQIWIIICAFELIFINLIIFGICYIFGKKNMGIYRDNISPYFMYNYSKNSLTFFLEMACFINIYLILAIKYLF
jgi:hypothetical protein